MRIRGCLCRTPDLNFSIPDPGLRVTKKPDPDPHQRIQVFVTQKTASKLSEKLSWVFKPDPGSGFFFLSRIRIPDPGVKKAPDPGSGSSTLVTPVFHIPVI
jgi:hypothetical protein